MAIPSCKKELLEAISENYEKLKGEIKTIPPELSINKDLEGHAKNTLMSVCDLLAYLNGWGQLVLKWNTKKEKGLKVDFPETGYKWNELGALAQKFYMDHEDQNFDQLQKSLDKTVKSLLELVNSRKEHQLYGVLWYEKYTLGRMIQLNTSSPYQNARLRIRKWKKGQRLK